MKKLVKIFIVIILLGGGAVFYAFMIEPALLKVNKHTLTASKGGDTLKIIQLSDIQVSENYSLNRLEKLIKKVNKLDADIIVFTGDLFENYSQFPYATEVAIQLKKLHPKYGKYAVWGNRDYGGGAVRIYNEVLSNGGFHLLKNEGTTFPISHNKKLFIGGLDDAIFGSPNIKNTLLHQTKEANYSILLMHEPDVADQLSASTIDLALAGHSHGGQIHLPFTKRKTNTLAEKYIAGFYDVNGMTLYVNTGIGTSRIPARFMVPPEIALFTIHL